MASTTKRARWLAGLLFLLAGCGGGAHKSAQAPVAGSAVVDVPAPAPPPRFDESAATSSPSASAGASDAAEAPGTWRGEAKSSARAPAPESRPGLGTEWGESRTSRVHDVSFVRDSSQPFAIATFRYDDRRGVERMVGRHPSRDSRWAIDTGGGAVTMAIKGADGDPLEAIHVGDRTYVVGHSGERYSIVLTNRTGHRLESVVTVDGLDVIDGKPGTVDNRGYVLLPYATLEIEGFRRSADAVAAFRFASVGESYAAQTGSARNVGVIGAAFFGERGDVRYPWPSEAHLRETADPFPTDSRYAQPPRR